MVESRIGFQTVRRYKNDYNLTRTFSDADYSQCTCSLILTTMYTQMIEHCSGAGKSAPDGQITNIYQINDRIGGEIDECHDRFLLCMH